jgi:hypothetical protein
MTLASAVETYVRLKQSLGAVFVSDARTLAAFVRAVGDVPVNTITPDVRHFLPRPRSANPVLVTQTERPPGLLSVPDRARAREPLAAARAPARAFSRPSSGTSIRTPTLCGCWRQPPSRSATRESRRTRGASCSWSCTRPLSARATLRPADQGRVSLTRFVVSDGIRVAALVIVMISLPDTSCVWRSTSISGRVISRGRLSSA